MIPPQIAFGLNHSDWEEAAKISILNFYIINETLFFFLIVEFLKILKNIEKLNIKIKVSKPKELLLALLFGLISCHSFLCSIDFQMTIPC